MPIQSRDGVRYFSFDSFGSGVVQAVFTRQGGVSPKPWASLNVGGTVGDQAERVRENRRRAFTSLGLDAATLFDVWQVHGINVVIADAPHPPRSPHLCAAPTRQADAILSDKAEVSLFMRFADCVPILLYDPLRKVIGLAHAGWMGTVRGVVRAALEAMQARFGTQPADLQAAIGPSIGQDHYAVGPDVVTQVRQAFGEDASGLLATIDGGIHFDLWAANRLLLEQAGVRQVEVAGLCTACHLDDWYSHRAEKGRTGRFGALIALKT
ncbi:MAG: peptidoglycan editing factor PgeF [Chloroflexi bacterium]|nr:peptidoglycan editing factor PgeF [Chloroflexota bacterium]